MRLGRLLTTTIAGVLLLAASAGAQPAQWRVPEDFATIQEAIDSASVVDGDIITVGPGKHTGATVTKAVTIAGTGHSDIVDGPVVSAQGNAGFYFPGGGDGSGATISDFSFTRVAFPVFSRGADTVTVSGNTMRVFLQGVTNWGYGSWGNGWQIADNTMHNYGTDCGAGIGILIGDFQGATVTGNTISGNRMRGRVSVPSGDCGGYNAPGIVLYSDFRFGATGATIQGNTVTENRLLFQEGNPRLGGGAWKVTVSGIELSDTRDDWMIQPPVIQGNSITYNDLRGMKVPFFFTPDEIGSANTIENNDTGPGGTYPDRRYKTSAPPSVSRGSRAAPVR